LKGYRNVFRGHPQRFELTWCTETRRVLPEIVQVNVTSTGNPECFKTNFTTFKVYISLFRGHAQRFELPWCSKRHRVLPGIVTVQYDFH
jgi:hypothetical protein